jgi:hypothetical protein
MFFSFSPLFFSQIFSKKELRKRNASYCYSSVFIFASTFLKNLKKLSLGKRSKD